MKNITSDPNQWYRVSLLGHRSVVCQIVPEELHGLQLWRLAQPHLEGVSDSLVNPSTAVFEVEPYADPRPLEGLPDGWGAQLLEGFSTDRGWRYTVTDPWGHESVTLVKNEASMRALITATADRAKTIDPKVMTTWSGCLKVAREVYEVSPTETAYGVQEKLYNRAVSMAKKMGTAVGQTWEEFRRKLQEHNSPGVRAYLTAGGLLVAHVPLPRAGGGVVRIGAARGGPESIWISDAERHTVARMHAVIERQGDTYTVIDLGSDAGTLVNGERIQPEPSGATTRVVKPGDKIGVGPYTIVITEEPPIDAELDDENPY